MNNPDLHSTLFKLLLNKLKLSSVSRIEFTFYFI